MTTTPPEALREMGAEFDGAASLIAQAMQSLELSRRERLEHLREMIKRNQAHLVGIKEELRTLPGQIAKWEAERARLESQTGLDLLRAVLGGDVQAVPKPSHGLPWVRVTERLPEFDQAKRVVIYTADHESNGAQFFECSADELYTEDGDENEPAKNATHWIDVDLLREAVTEKRSAHDPRYDNKPDNEPRAEVEAMADARQKPALLDLRTLKVGTVCEARDRIQIPYTAVSIRAGVLFTIEEHCKPPIAPGEDVRVRVASTTDTWAIPALVPARVVKEGQ